MQLGDAVDPTTSSSMPSVARLVGLLVTAVMLAVGGHRLLLGVLLDSFEAIPAGHVTFHDSMMTLMVDQLSAGMAAGVRVAAPVIAALLLSNLVTGLISRTLASDQCAGDRTEHQRVGNARRVGCDHRLGRTDFSR